MYGKHFASMYEGSMMGAGCTVFAVWGYIISKTVGGRVELNPKLIAAVLGCSVDDVKAALDYLSQPDPNSRCQDYEGRRLVKEGQYQYFLPTHQHYSKIKSEAERREYNRIKQAEHRLRLKLPKPTLAAL